MSTAAPQGTNWWKVVGIVLAVLFVIGGLVMVAMVVMVFVAIGSFGSNK